MRFQPGCIQLQNRFSEHTQGQVDQLQFDFRERPNHLAEDGVGQLYVIDTVPPVVGEVFRREIGTALALGIQYLGAFDPHTVALCEGFQADAMLHTVDSPCHAQGVKPYLWLDPKPP